MEQTKEKNTMLDLITQPGFCAKDGVITQVNDAAAALLLTPGMQVAPLLLTGAEEWEAFQDGCLYLKLNLNSQGVDAFVTRVEEEQVFLLEWESERELQTLALAAQSLRKPLTGLMASASNLSTYPAEEATAQEVARLNRGLHQMLRLLGNMSDACHIPDPSRQELTNLSFLFQEIFQKAQAMLALSGISLTYQGLDRDVSSLANRDQLERAILNILSNAARFTPKGGQIHASLSLKGRILRLQILDTGSGIAEEVRSTLFQRYLRQPGIEDSRRGLGLGMVLIRNAAASHGGTVLIDQPKEGGTRVSLTLAIRKAAQSTLRCPRMRMDYTGGWDHTLVELSDVLPLQAYLQETD